MSHPLRRSVCLAILGLGSGSTSAQTPVATWDGLFEGDAMGSVIEVIGDCDGDGVADIAHGSPDADHQIFIPVPVLLEDVGRVQVRSGRTGAVLYDIHGQQGGAEFGYAITGVGDIDDDGRADFLVGSPRFHESLGVEGMVQVRSGANGTLLRTHYGTQRRSRFGHALSSSLIGAAGYAVGAPHYDLNDSVGGHGEEGRVFLYEVSSGAALNTFSGGTVSFPGNTLVQAYARHFGWALDHQSVGLAIGAPLSDITHAVSGTVDVEAGLVWCFASGYIAVEKGSAGSRFGTALEFNDAPGEAAPLRIAVGTPGVLPHGNVTVMAPAFEAPHIWTTLAAIHGTAAAPLGEVVEYVGDVDGDGVDDLAVGSPDAASAFPIGVPGVGKVRVVSQLDGSPLADYGGTSPFDRLGAAITGADMNGDGKADLLIGVPGDDGPSTDSGSTWTYLSTSCPAGSVFYGSGWPGTLSIPSISTSQPPVLGESFALQLGNSLGAATQAWFFVGLAPDAVTVKGGTLLVDPFMTFTVPMGSGTLSLPFLLPDEPLYCGLSAFLQGLVIDPGASHGVAFSRGLELQLGE